MNFKCKAKLAALGIYTFVISTIFLAILYPFPTLFTLVSIGFIAGVTLVFAEIYEKLHEYFKTKEIQSERQKEGRYRNLHERMYDGVYNTLLMKEENNSD